MNRNTNLILSSALVLSFASLSHADVQVPLHAPTINTALAMAGPGGTVTVSRGTYYENVSFPFSNQTLRADGKVTVDAGGGTGIFVPVGVIGADIEDMRVRNASIGIYLMGHQATVEGCQIRLTSSHGILLNNSDNSTIEHTKIKDVGSQGIYLYLSDNCTVEENSVKRAAETGIYVLGSVNSILDNQISDTGSHGIQLGTSSYAAVGNLVDDNEIKSAGYDGISCASMSATSTIQENVIRNTVFDGIDVNSSSNGHTLFKNKIYVAGDNGIEVTGDGCTVSRNKCWQSIDSGIQVSAGSNSGLYFKNKIKFSQVYGLKVLYTGNTFTQNKMKFNLVLDRYSSYVLAANTWINNAFNTSNV